MFKMVLQLAWQSLCFRRGAAIITLLAIAVSVFTLLSVEHLRQTAKQSFNSTVSGVDLIVGPRTGGVNLLLTTVFRIGQPAQNMSFQSFQRLLDHKNVDWAIPISLGDSHRGFRVVGTNDQFFRHFKYSQSRNLTFAQGQAFLGIYDVVIGASIARQLGYGVGQKLVIAHGLGRASLQNHDKYPFTVTGVLKPTGTPVDNALYVKLEGLEAIHKPAYSNATALDINALDANGLDLSLLQPASISAAMVGLKSKFSTFKVQREINTDIREPLTAILPGVTLMQLWQMSRGIEQTLSLMTKLILFASLLGLGAVMMATLRERSYELSVLRTLGAGSATLFVLIQIEALFITLLGIAFGGLLFVAVLFFLDDFAAITYGIDISLSQISNAHGIAIVAVLLGALTVSALPALLGFLRVQISAKAP